MADVPFEQVQTEPHPAGLDPNSLQYWCYHCNKRVSIETSADLPDIICHECKNGFVESIDSHQPPSLSGASDPIDDPAFGDQFLQVLRLITQVARDDDAPPPPPSEHADPSDDDYLRIELDGWDNDDDGEEEEEDDDDDGNQSVIRNDDADNQGRRNENQDRSEDGEEEGEEEEENDDENENRQGRGEDVLSRSESEVLRLRLRDVAGRSANRRNRILDWAEILMGLEDHSIELRFAVPDGNGYIGNPGDYLDAAGYETLLHNLAENDNGGRTGPPPASKHAIEALETLEIKAECEPLACAVCKDVVGVGEMAKKLPCGHGYHGDCIVPWLGSRNSCPVCRYELPTDDPDYEEEKKKRAGPGPTITSTSGGSNGGGFDP